MADVKLMVWGRTAIHKYIDGKLSGKKKYDCVINATHRRALANSEHS